MLLTSAWALALLVAFSAVDFWRGAGLAKGADRTPVPGFAALAGGLGGFGGFGGLGGLRKSLTGAARARDMLGRNALFIYALSMLLPGLLRWLRGPPPSATAALQPASLGASSGATPGAGSGAVQDAIHGAVQAASSPGPARAIWESWVLCGLDPRLASLAFAVANVVFYGLVAWALDRRRIYIRL